ncbi:hypothetical protein COV88_01905 [Candidatus Saccharibacteria bacterium CG11_big_fil_rev_8_21_14_0_20_41_19]|nr:insulinase family protein [Candidatus Saccharibacteria bacterium]OIP85761.1 MAG: hypothetical protein AUK57_02815 [Candidatus Saccharibacteria bacterium CG2_30_41_52]PIQ70877.1 MAG: hypothetical protein COV88_01905 [Candidatus Saccharibacteria bacterium CG11_big_fil_rev_8_21_14_0_20_41_19]PIZ61208.1 MAG: hypothetical protein COY18_00300 [Candidatus Saccharibacteria bacterium CG_4_10_14_0_2_um_filter_41_11]PJC29666.1 MAG: hypothetical protein CO052_02145 [Candidatus Saccharibacteria bacterium
MPLKHIVEEITLNSGAKGLIIDVPDSTVVSYDIGFRAGYDYAEPLVQQSAHLLEHMAFGVSDGFETAEVFSQEFTKNGAHRGATTYDRGMSYGAESAVMEWERIMDLFQAAITRPIFTQKTLDSEKGNVREELVSQADNHSRVLYQHIQRALGSKRLMDPEKIETIERIQLSDVQNHYRKTHTLKNMRFSIAGDLSKYKDEIIKKLNQWDLPIGDRLPALELVSKSSPMVHVYRKDMSNLLFRLQMDINRELSNIENVAMSALGHILTGTFHSRIYGKARSQGICYNMGSGSSSDISGVSSWWFYGKVQLENADTLFRLIIEQIKKVLDGDITEEELDAAKQYALGGYQMRGQTVSSISGWYTSYYFGHDEIDPLESSPDRIKSTTREDIVKLAKEFINNCEWTLGGIGNASSEQLQSHYDLFATLLNNKDK